jgi:hypothetical protein
MFLRFVVGGDSDNAAWLTGIIAEAEILREKGKLYSYESEWLEEIFEWFNEHLPCPPFSQRRRTGEWTEDAVSWFRAEAGEPLRRIWDIVAILEEHGVPVRLVTTEKPGKILYSDEYQVVAETPYWA